MSNIEHIDIHDFNLWDKKEHQKRQLYSFELELTARCNMNCRHCYINLSANDKLAKLNELSLEEIEKIADQALELGAVWVLLTGGEPLLRSDFEEIFLLLKHKGFLVSVFTNATLIKPDHLSLFRKYPPRDIEITIYGASENVYESVTRVSGSYNEFMRGINMLNDAGIPIRLKSMAIRSNMDEIEAMADFGQKFSKDYYRYDPVLHLRYDRDESRNREIISERLNPEEIAKIEKMDNVRIETMKKNHDKYYFDTFAENLDNHLFKCGAGNGSFTVGYDGTFRLCSSLWAPGTTVNLRDISLRDAWEKFVPHVRDFEFYDEHQIDICSRCPIVNLCLNCPAHAYLETGYMKAVVPYFCQVAHARAEALNESINGDKS